MSRSVATAEGNGRGPTAPIDKDGQPWPLMPLGHFQGIFHFLDVRGQKRELTARLLGRRHDLLSLFGGNDAWLRAQFPQKKLEKSVDAEGADSVVWRTVDFAINDAAAALQRACFDAGLYGDHIQLRQPGIWRDQDSQPVVHCGDQVLIGDRWLPAGEREGNQIWAAAAPTARPGIPCAVDVGRHIQAGLTTYWRWRECGGPTAMLGLIANSYLGAALDWRPAAFITGDTGSGKTNLMDVTRAALPLHHFDNDPTKAGIEQIVAGRAMPIVIDEAADRANQGVGRALADLVLSASSGEGTRGSRGTADGRGRRFELAGLIMMFSINPPDLEPQHLGRMMLLELMKPDGGADFKREHRALVRFARDHGAALWGRVLGAWDRYQTALERFRQGLGASGCAPREMDQAGALLAGWWILTEEGLPDERGIRAGISALHGGELTEPGLIRGAEEIEADSRSRLMLQHLMASMINLHRSSEREPIGKLIEIGLGETDLERQPDAARALLTDHGIRVVLACQRPGDPNRPLTGCRCNRCWDPRGPVPRVSDDAGVWFATQNPELRKLFNGTPFEGDRWKHEMMRLHSARPSRRNVRIGTGSMPGRAIWLSRAELFPREERSL
jgi:hypothetical protein